MRKTCAVCGASFEAQIDEDSNEVLTGAYFGEVQGVEYWECMECDKNP